METSLRFLAAIVMTGGVAVGLLTIDLQEASKAVGDFMQLPANHLIWEQEKTRTEVLTNGMESTGLRMARKNAIVTRVLERQITLREAVDEFLVVSIDCPYPWDVNAEVQSGWSLEKRCAHLIIVDAADRLRDAGRGDDAILQTLRCELETLDD